MEDILTSYPAMLLVINSISITAGFIWALYRFVDRITKPLEKIYQLKINQEKILENQNNIAKYLIEIKATNK